MPVKILEDIGDVLTKASRAELISAIIAASGRTIVGETVTFKQPLIDGVSNIELLKSWGADMVTINHYNVDMPMIPGMTSTEQGVGEFLSHWNVQHARGIAPDRAIVESSVQNAFLQFGFGRVIGEAKRLAGIPVGITLEPVAENDQFPKARLATMVNAQKAISQGANYITLIHTPSMDRNAFLGCVKEVRQGVKEGGLVNAGKMPWGGSFLQSPDDFITEEEIRGLAKAGADVVIVPAPGTVPGLTVELVRKWVLLIHECGLLAETTIGTSQEGADVEVIRRFAIDSKMTGADIHQIGDSVYSGTTTPENLMAFATSIKGRRHTLRRMAISPLRGE